MNNIKKQHKKLVEFILMIHNIICSPPYAVKTYYLSLNIYIIINIFHIYFILKWYFNLNVILFKQQIRETNCLSYFI